MIYCAIDTSTDWCNIGLYKNKNLIVLGIPSNSFNQEKKQALK